VNGKSVYYYTGPVHTGKTTRLSQWISRKKKVDGILAPVIDRCRYLRIISTGETKKLDAADSGDDGLIVKIGQYIFSEEVFSWARQHLTGAFKNNPDWLIIDEIGPLELTGRGLEPAVSEILSLAEKNNEIKIVLVIREKILAQTLHHYHLTGIKKFTIPV